MSSRMSGGAVAVLLRCCAFSGEKKECVRLPFLEPTSASVFGGRKKNI